MQAPLVRNCEPRTSVAPNWLLHWVVIIGYAAELSRPVAGVVSFHDPAATAGALTILHYALPSPMTEAFASLRSGRVLQYHNVTPASYFAPYDPALFRLATLGRDELKTLAGHVDLALGDSEYNRRELETLGFERTGVFPIAVDTARITQPARRPALEHILEDGLVNRHSLLVPFRELAGDVR